MASNIKALCLLIGLTGCSTTAEIVERGADANDAALNAAVFTICHGASIGSVRRKFGARMEAWQGLCQSEDPMIKE